jgi:hypothetical protein
VRSPVFPYTKNKPAMGRKKGCEISGIWRKIALRLEKN